MLVDILGKQSHLAQLSVLVRFIGMFLLSYSLVLFKKTLYCHEEVQVKGEYLLKRKKKRSLQISAVFVVGCVYVCGYIYTYVIHIYMCVGI